MSKKTGDFLCRSIAFAFLFSFANCQKPSRKDLRSNRDGAAVLPTSTPNNPATPKLNVVRIESAQRTAFAHQIDYAEAVERNTLIKEIELTTGCSQSVDIKNKLLMPSESPKLKSISSRGFANGDAERKDQKSIALNFSQFQYESTTWDWSLVEDDKTTKVNVGIPAYFTEVNLESIPNGEKNALWLSDLVQIPDPIIFDDSKDMVVTWKSEQLGDSSFVLLHLKGKSNSMRCIFSAKDQSGKIESKTLKAVDGREMQISAHLASYRVFSKERLLVASHDWKQGLLVRQ